MRPLFAIFALFLVSAAAAHGLSRGLTFFGAQPRIDWQGNECDGVTSGTHVCNYNCTKVLLCRGEEVDPIELATCSDPFGCVQGQCVNGSSSCEHSNTPIQCTSRGLFPDPEDCTKYHICKAADGPSKAQTCDHGWAYDPLTAVCSKQPTDSPCTELPIICAELGESKAFPGNPSIYYVCVSNTEGEIYPTLYRCPHGGIYNPSTFLCDDAPSTPSMSPSTALSLSTSSPTTLSSSASPSTSSSTASASAPTTPSSPSPPTPSSTSQSPSPPTSSPTSSATSPTSSTTTATPPSPGDPCSTPAEVVADPNDCFGYYQCFPTHKWTHVDCIYGYYFNREEVKCIYGPCPYTSW